MRPCRVVSAAVRLSLSILLWASGSIAGYPTRGHGASLELELIVFCAGKHWYQMPGLCVFSASRGKLLMIEILHGLTYQNPRSSGRIVNNTWGHEWFLSSTVMHHDPCHPLQVKATSWWIRRHPARAPWRHRWQRGSYM